MCRATHTIALPCPVTTTSRRRRATALHDDAGGPRRRDDQPGRHGVPRARVVPALVVDRAELAVHEPGAHQNDAHSGARTSARRDPAKARTAALLIA